MSVTPDSKRSDLGAEKGQENATVCILYQLQNLQDFLLLFSSFYSLSEHIFHTATDFNNIQFPFKNPQKTAVELCCTSKWAKTARSTSFVDTCSAKVSSK